MKTPCLSPLHAVALVFICCFLPAADAASASKGAPPAGPKGANDRASEQALRRRFDGNPNRELELNTKRGDYRFRGVAGFAVGSEHAPGLPPGSYRASEINYVVLDQRSATKAKAERYFERYNKALLSHRQGKALTRSGMLARRARI
jgi:hypothetical protein